MTSPLEPGSHNLVSNLIIRNPPTCSSAGLTLYSNFSMIVFRPLYLSLSILLFGSVLAVGPPDGMYLPELVFN